ncbi:MAG: hypothetical protein HFF39_01140 [Lawsonibacter sp.]|nr:hypothetical protein [Lawsonibacter sp.]
MNNSAFLFVMKSIDDTLLEEAQRPAIKVRPRLQFLGIAGLAAACILVVLSLRGWLYTGEKLFPSQSTPVTDPASETAFAEIQRLGYTLPVPSDAQDVFYALLDSDFGSTPIAEVTYKSGGRSYSCRALKSQQPENISGLYQEWTHSLDWKAGRLQMQLRQSDTDAWVGWYAPDAEVQWCLSGGEDALSLLHTAQQLLETLGYGVTAAPEQAEDILYNAFALDDLTVGETEFMLDGVHYSYRMAQTWAIDEDFADISGMDGSFQHEAEVEITWCPARLYYDEGGAGKVVWFDVVPGLLYSLSMDQGASEEALLAMANQLFAPAQGDVG